MASLYREPQTKELSLVAILHALGDETRLQIARTLAEEGELTCRACAPEGPKSSLSHHFRVLRSSGVIATRKEGTTLLNRLRQADIDQQFPGLLGSVLPLKTRARKTAG